MYAISIPKLILIFAIVVVMFGEKRLPKIATSLGEAINNFRQALKGGNLEDNSSHDQQKLSLKR